MHAESALRRLKAWHAGKPLPLYSTLHLRIAEPEDILIAAFVRMGGESSPWALAIGHPTDKPEVFAVPEARNRDLVADMMAEVAPLFLAHFRHPEWTDTPVTTPEEPLPIRQLWVPNQSHLDLLHSLAYAYTFTKWGEATRAETLNALGRLCGWLFREAQRPGQMSAMVATSVLRACYSFPASDLRQSHLGYLLAWLEEKGSREKRLKAATEAEQRSTSITLDPAIERDRLDDLVEKWGAARKAEDDRRAGRHSREIEKILEDEVVHRFDLVNRTIDCLGRDRRRENAGVAKLIAESRREHWYQYVRIERQFDDEDDGPAFVPSPETDRYPAAAAARYYVHASSEEYRISVLLHDDEELQEEAIASGDAIRGEIIDVWDEGTTRSTRPVWIVELATDVPLRVREGSTLCVAGLAGRTTRVREIRSGPSSTIRVEVEIIGLRTVPKVNPKNAVLRGADPKHRGKVVTLLPTAKDQISRMKGRRVWERTSPGSWLTHAAPAGPQSALPDEIADPVDSLASAG